MDSFTFRWSWQTRWALSLGLTVSASLAFAQETTSPAVNRLKYSSVFIEYQGFKEQPVSSWRETNNVVEKIGGWRMYAKEAVLPDAANKAPTSAGKKELHGEHGRKP